MLLDFILGPLPDLIRAAPVYHELRARLPHWTVRLIDAGHEGPWQDGHLRARLLDELRMPEPDLVVEVPAETYLQQIARTMLELERLFLATRPDAVVVFGDGNPSLAAALAASQLGIRVARVDAGLRTFRRAAADEMNRVLTDAVAEWLFVSERQAEANLRNERIDERRVHFAGDPLIDSLLEHGAAAARLDGAASLGLARGRYVFAALYQPENVEAGPQLCATLYALLTVADRADVVFPMREATLRRLRGSPAWDDVHGHPRLRLMESVGYLEYLSLVRDAGAVLTDSGSVQAEAIALGVPCVALRDRSERQAAVQHGHARLVGHDPYLAVTYLKEMLADWPGTYLPPPEGWDGRAASRIVNVLQEELEPAAAAVNGPGLQDVRA